MKKLGTITKQFGIGKQPATQTHAWSIMNIKQTNKENKQIVEKRKAITKSTEKIGPKIVSKYSQSKYHSNFEEGIEDPLESTDFLKLNEEGTIMNG